MSRSGRRVLRSRWKPFLVAMMGPALALGAAHPASGVASRASGWELVSSPNAGSSRSALADVVAVSANDVWAVGSAFDDARALDRPLIEHWNGAAWKRVSTPDVGRGFAALTGVAAVGPNDVWAVGSFVKQRFGSEHSLILHWDGSAWTQVASPLRAQWDGLTGVAAVASDDVWAAGNGYRGAFILHFDGTTWAKAPGSDAAWLEDIVAVGPNDVWAVGQGVFNGVYPTFTEHWDGVAWSEVPSPSTALDFNEFRAVSGSSHGDVWAVGAAWDSTKPLHPLTAHWDGSGWTIVPSAPMPEGELFGVASVSGSDAWAVGRSNGTAVTQQWNGSAWQLAPNPSPGVDNSPNGVVVSGGVGWAVGSTNDGSIWCTLIMRTLSP